MKLQGNFTLPLLNLANYTEAEKRIIDELFYIHDVDSLVGMAFKFVSDHSSLFELYSKDDVMNAFVDLYWECVT